MSATPTAGPASTSSPTTVDTDTGPPIPASLAEDAGRKSSLLRLASREIGQRRRRGGRLRRTMRSAHYGHLPVGGRAPLVAESAARLIACTIPRCLCNGRRAEPRSHKSFVANGLSILVR